MIDKENEEITNMVRDVYNQHLIYTRNFHNMPVKKEHTFKGFDDDEKFKNYHQLAIWFKRHPEINVRLFFEAYLHYHSDRIIIPIKYYIQKNALTFYIRYRKMIESMQLDETLILKSCKESFNYIENFCERMSIEIQDYITYKEEGSIVESWLKHVKRGNVNIHILFAYDKFFNKLKSLYKDVDIWNFYIGENDPPYAYIKRWESSKIFQDLSKKTINKNKHKQKTNK